MSINGIIGEQVSYEGLGVGILNEAEGSYRVVIIDRASEFSSSCAGYTAAGIRERALELAYAYLLKRDGAARKPSAGLVWKPIRIDIDPHQRQSDGSGFRCSPKLPLVLNVSAWAMIYEDSAALIGKYRKLPEIGACRRTSALWALYVILNQHEIRENSFSIL